MGFVKTRDEDETANLIWSDSAVQQEKIAELRNYQVEHSLYFWHVSVNFHLESFSNTFWSVVCIEREKTKEQNNARQTVTRLHHYIFWKNYSLFCSYLFIPFGIWCLNVWSYSFMLLSAHEMLWIVTVNRRHILLNDLDVIVTTFAWAWSWMFWVIIGIDFTRKAKKYPFTFSSYSSLRESTIFQEWERSAERIFWQETWLSNLSFSTKKFFFSDLMQ